MILSLIRKKNIGLGINGIKLNDYLELYIFKEETLVYIVPSSNRLGSGPFKAEMLGSNPAGMTKIKT